MVAEVIGKRRGGMCLVDRCTDNEWPDGFAEAVGWRQRWWFGSVW